MNNGSPTFIHTPFVNQTMELIQERIDIKKQDLEWMENNPEVHHYIYNQTMNQCLISELDFLGKLVESMRKGGI